MTQLPKTPVTMRDVARAAGVSRMTVSRALKKDSPVSRETRERILKVLASLRGERAAVGRQRDPAGDLHSEAVADLVDACLNLMIGLGR